MNKEVKKSMAEIKRYINTIKEAEETLKTETKERKIEKAHKIIGKRKRFIEMENEELIKKGENILNYRSSFDEYELSIIDEVFKNSVVVMDKEELEIKKEIDYYKEKIRNIKTYRAVDPYEEDWPMEKKKKSKFHHAQRNLESRLTLRSDENSHEYVDIWNYERDYESTKDKYFTQEEQEEIKEALRVGAEYLAWYAEKYPKRVAMGGKLVDWAGLKRAKIEAEFLSKDVFPMVIKQIKGETLSKTEQIEEARMMTRRFINYRSNPENVERALDLAGDAIKRAKVMVEDMCISLDENQLMGLSGLILDLIINKVEDTIKDEKAIQGVALELLQKECGMEEAYFIILLNRETEREEITRYLTRYSFEELGI